MWLRCQLLLIWDFLSRVSPWLLLEISPIFQGWPLFSRESPGGWCSRPRPIHISLGSPSTSTGQRVSHRCREDWVSSSVLCSPRQKPIVLVYVQSQIPAGDPGPSTSWHFTDPDMQVHFRGCAWLQLPKVWPPRRSRPRQDLALCYLSWEVSWLRGGWMLEPQQQELSLENVVLGCTDWPASRTALNRRHLYFPEKKI